MSTSIVYNAISRYLEGKDAVARAECHRQVLQMALAGGQSEMLELLAAGDWTQSTSVAEQLADFLDCIPDQNSRYVRFICLPVWSVGDGPTRTLSPDSVTGISGELGQGVQVCGCLLDSLEIERIPWSRWCSGSEQNLCSFPDPGPDKADAVRLRMLLLRHTGEVPFASPADIISNHQIRPTMALLEDSFPGLNFLQAAEPVCAHQGHGVCETARIKAVLRLWDEATAGAKCVAQEAIDANERHCLILMDERSQTVGKIVIPETFDWVTFRVWEIFREWHLAHPNVEVVGLPIDSRASLVEAPELNEPAAGKIGYTLDLNGRPAVDSSGGVPVFLTVEEANLQASAAHGQLGIRPMLVLTVYQLAWAGLPVHLSPGVAKRVRAVRPILRYPIQWKALELDGSMILHPDDIIIPARRAEFSKTYDQLFQKIERK